MPRLGDGPQFCTNLVMVGWPAITHILLVIYLLCIPLFTIATPMVGRPARIPWNRGLKHSSHHGRDPMLNESLFVSLKSESFLVIFALGRLRGCSHIFVFSETMNPKAAIQLSRSKCQSHPSPFGSFHGSNVMMSTEDSRDHQVEMC